MQKRSMLQSLAAAGALALLGGLSGCSKPETRFQGVDITGAEYGRDFPLADAEGKQRSIRDFAGKVVVVFFGYTQCPDVCPTTMQELAEVKRGLGAQGDRLQGVFITVDPERDTPEVLRAYTQNFDAPIVGVSGSPEQIAAVAKDFKVFFRKVDGKTPGTYTMDHSAGLYVYDPAGRLRVYHRYGTGAQPLLQDVQALLAEKA